MKIINLVTLLAMLLSASISYAVTQSYGDDGDVMKARIIEAPVSHVFIPNGFDSNDNVQVVVIGRFPTTCYQLYTHAVRREGSQIKVYVYAIYQSDRPCADAIVPFKQEINLGAANKGVYDIVVNPGSSHPVHGRVPVVAAKTNRIDDYIYAYVEYIGSVKNDPNRVKIGGYIASDCFKFKQFHKMTNKKDVIAVLPILEQVSDFCPMKMTPFEYAIDIPKMNSRQVLLHVRSMEGQSVNKVLYY